MRVAMASAFLPTEEIGVDGSFEVTEVTTAPWMSYLGRRATPEQRLEALRRFHDDVLVQLS